MFPYVWLKLWSTVIEIMETVKIVVNWKKVNCYLKASDKSYTNIVNEITYHYGLPMTFFFAQKICLKCFRTVAQGKMTVIYCQIYHETYQKRYWRLLQA